MPTRVKICGCTSEDDVRLAVDAGADAVGFIFADSLRRVELGTAIRLSASIPESMCVVAVVADPTLEFATKLRLGMPRVTFQFHGGESPSFCREATMGAPYVKVFHIKDGADYRPEDFTALLAAYHDALPMFDSNVGGRSGGTGITFSWNVLRQIEKPRFIVSGGLTPANVGECVRMLRPYGVDVRSGVETAGLKDAGKVRAFVQAVREADASA